MSLHTPVCPSPDLVREAIIIVLDQYFAEYYILGYNAV
jgi:hypothetical protein